MVLAIAAVGAVQWRALPRSIDIYYHLSVAEAFIRSGGYSPVAFWEYAPVGRPHLYPPLFHFLILALRKAGLGIIDAARFIDAALPVLLVSAVWAATRRLYSPRLAFFAAITASSLYSFYVASFLHPAFTLGFSLGLLAVVFLAEGRTVAAFALAALSLFSHGFMAWLVPVTAIGFECIRGGRLALPGKKALAAVFGALLLAAPLGWHFFQSRAFFNPVPVQADRFWPFSLAVWGMAAAGLFLALRRGGRHLFPLCLFIGMLPFLLMHPQRVVSGHGLAAVAVLAAFALDAGYEKAVSWRPWAGGTLVAMVAVFLHFWNPYADYDSQRHSVRLSAPGAALVKGVYRPDQDDARLKTIYFEGPVKDISAIVSRGAGPGDILWCNLNYPGAMIAALNGLATSSATLAEVAPYRDFDAKAAARVLLWFKNPDGMVPGDAEESAKRYGLEKAGETEMAVIYFNRLGRHEVSSLEILNKGGK